MSAPGGGRPPGLWDRIMASRHRRSILGSLAVLALLIVVVVAGLVGGDGSGTAGTGHAVGRPAPGVSTGSFVAAELLAAGHERPPAALVL